MVNCPLPCWITKVLFICIYIYSYIHNIYCIYPIILQFYKFLENYRTCNPDKWPCPIVVFFQPILHDAISAFRSVSIEDEFTTQMVKPYQQQNDGRLSTKCALRTVNKGDKPSTISTSSNQTPKLENQKLPKLWDKTAKNEDIQIYLIYQQKMKAA